VGRVMADKYEKLLNSGWLVTEEEIRRDLEDLYSRNFWRFVGRSSGA